MVLDRRKHFPDPVNSICPGRFFAEAVLWLTMVRVIAAFDILPALDANGNPQIPEIVIKPGVSRLA